MKTTAQNTQSNPQRPSRPFAWLVLALVIVTSAFALDASSLRTSPSWKLVLVTILSVWFVLANLGGVWFYRRQFGYGREKAYLLWIATLLGAAGCGICRGLALKRADEIAHRFSEEQRIVPLVIWTALLVLVAVPFVLKLHSKWMDDRLTDGEKAPGAEGMRAWLSIGNLFFVLLIALLSWLAFGYSFFIVLGLLIVVLLAYPLLNFPAQPDVSAAYRSEDLSAERERILRMLENGKICDPPPFADAKLPVRKLGTHPCPGRLCLRNCRRNEKIVTFTVPDFAAADRARLAWRAI